MDNPTFNAAWVSGTDGNPGAPDSDEGGGAVLTRIHKTLEEKTTFRVMEGLLLTRPQKGIEGARILKAET